GAPGRRTTAGIRPGLRKPAGRAMTLDTAPPPGSAMRRRRVASFIGRRRLYSPRPAAAKARLAGPLAIPDGHELGEPPGVRGAVMTIGLTGGIGSGKSTVAAILAELGARVIDADRIGHEGYRPGSPGFAAVVDAFGPAVVDADGTIDRSALGAIVFADPAARARLNAIVHPLIAAELAARIER